METHPDIKTSLPLEDYERMIYGTRDPSKSLAKRRTKRTAESDSEHAANLRFSKKFRGFHEKQRKVKEDAPSG